MRSGVLSAITPDYSDNIQCSDNTNYSYYRMDVSVISRIIITPYKDKKYMQTFKKPIPKSEPYRDYLKRSKAEAPHDPEAVGRLFIEVVESFAVRDSPCAVTAQRMVSGSDWPPAAPFAPARASDASMRLYKAGIHPKQRWSHIKTFYKEAVRKHRQAHVLRHEWTVA